MIRIALTLLGISGALFTAFFGLAVIGAQNGLQQIAWFGPLGSAAIVTAVCFGALGVIEALLPMRELLAEIAAQQRRTIQPVQPPHAPAAEPEKDGPHPRSWDAIKQRDAGPLPPRIE